MDRDKEIDKLYRIRDTVIKTLRSRKYNISEDYAKLSYNDFRELYRWQRHHLYIRDIQIPESEYKEHEKHDKSLKNILVYFEQSSEFTKKALESRVLKIKEEYKNLFRLFFVLNVDSNGKRNGTKKVNKFVAEILEDNNYLNIEILDNVYPFDFMNNCVLPEMKLLSAEEKENLLKIYKIELSKLRKILITDPVCKRLGAKLDDIIYVSRMNGMDISYLAVVNPGTS